jgi:hypothetical protein
LLEILKSKLEAETHGNPYSVPHFGDDFPVMWFILIGWLPQFKLNWHNMQLNVSEEHFMGVSTSVTFFLAPEQPQWPEFIIGAHCCNNVTGDYWWFTLLLKIIATIILDTVVTCDITDAFVTPMNALLMSKPLMCCE